MDICSNEMKSLELVQHQVAGRLFLALLLLLTTTSGQPVNDELFADNADAKVIYDQRQSGKYNIRINIKDVAIIEMDNSGFGDVSIAAVLWQNIIITCCFMMQENFGEEDYYYDEEDLTVKPLNFTKPPKVTTSHEVISTTTPQQATLLPTKFEEFISPHSTPIATTMYQQTNYNTNLLTDAMASQATSSETAPESIATSARLLASFQSTPSVFEPRSHNTIISRLSTAHPITLKPRLTSPISVQKELPRISGSVLKAHKLNHNFVNKFSIVQTPRSPLYTPAKGYGQRCRTHQYRDVNGSCNNKRSSSFL